MSDVDRRRYEFQRDEQTGDMWMNPAGHIGAASGNYFTEAAVRELVEALEKRGTHDVACDHNYADPATGRRDSCNCGLTDLLAHYKDLK